MLNIIEIFNSIQGEGSHIGEPSTFIRTAGCNLNCPGCDSKYSWGTGIKMTISEILHEVGKYKTNNIVLTGGEPTIQLDTVDLCSELHRAGYKVSVQTNGTNWTPLLSIADCVMMDATPDHFILSRIQRLDHHHDEIKVLVGDESDLDFAHKVNTFASRYDILTIVQVKNDFENDTRESLIAKYDWLSQQIFCEPVRILPQLHVLVWGNKRGV